MASDFQQWPQREVIFEFEYLYEMRVNKQLPDMKQGIGRWGLWIKSLESCDTVRLKQDPF